MRDVDDYGGRIGVALVRCRSVGSVYINTYGREGKGEAGIGIGWVCMKTRWSRRVGSFALALEIGMGNWDWISV
jgi:hypothetical protein